MKNYAPIKTKAPTELTHRIENGNIYILMICPEERTCLQKEELKCKYVKGHETKYDASKFPIDDIFITSLGCGAKFTLSRNNKGVYIESGDTKNI